MGFVRWFVMYILVFNEIFGLFFNFNFYIVNIGIGFYFSGDYYVGEFWLLLEMIVVILDVRILLLFVLKVEIGLINIDL